MRRLLTPCSALLLAAPLLAQSIPERAASALSPEILKGHLYYIASDTLQGRYTPSDGLDLAARYIAAQVRRIGLQPASENGSFFQEIEMVAQKSVLTLRRGEEEEIPLEAGLHWRGRGGPFSGELVFAGYGLKASDGSYDDLAGIDVKGKVAVVLEGLPAGIDKNLFQRTYTWRGRKRTRRMRNGTAALAGGAKGVVVLGSRAGSKSSAKPTYSLKRSSPRRFTPQPTVILTSQGCKRLGELLGVDFAALKKTIDTSAKPHSRALPGELILERRNAGSRNAHNVVAILPGTDPKLKDQYVGFGAHYDHIGAREEGEGDRIFNGADDDGSGTVALLALAEAFSRVPQRRRSLIFVWHCGEERGLVGSRYYTEHPLRPLASMVALFNIDMIGRNFRDDPKRANHVFLVGARKISTELGEIIEKANADGVGLELDENDPANYYQRSDHYSYASKGVPIAFFITGEHSDYHRASDHPDKILYEKMARIVRLIFASALVVTNREQRLVKDKLSGSNSGRRGR